MTNLSIELMADLTLIVNRMYNYKKVTCIDFWFVFI